MSTDVDEMMAVLDSGTFKRNLAKALSEVANAVVNFERVGKVTVGFDIRPLGSGAQVMINHCLTFVQPTMKGKISEDHTTSTPMFVDKKGNMTLMPNNQTDMFEDDKVTKLGSK